MTQKFSVSLDRRGTAYSGSLQDTPSGVELMPVTWSDDADWGYRAATVAATGPAERLGELLAWVGSRVSIRNELGTICWFGYLHEVEVNFGGSVVSVTLDGVWNKICVAYSSRLPDGSQQRRTTAWVTDDNSIAQYGTRELRLGADDISDDSALALRARTIAQSAWPAPTLRAGGQTSPPAATLHCKSYAALLDAMYYSNPNGIVEHTSASKGEQTIGAYKTATTISFTANDDIFDSGNGFGGLLVNDTIVVSGAANGANNGTFALVSADVGHLETVEKGQVLEAAGASVTVAYATQATTGLAQTLQLPADATAWACKKIAVRLYKRGSPTGNVVVSLHSDAGGGGPDTQLDSGTIACSALTERMAWVEFSMAAGTVMLQPATWYWIKVTRDTVTSIADHVVVGLDETGGYTIGYGRIQYLGAGWAVRDPGFDMPFRVTGAVDALDMVEEMIALSPDVATVEARYVGQTVWQYRDGERTALDEANDLLDLGSTGGNRLLVNWVFAPEGAQLSGVTIIEPPSSDERNPVLDAHGRLRQPTGAPWEPGLLAAGRWVDLEFLPVLDGVAAQAQGAAIFIERSQYNAQSDTISLESQGVTNPLMGVGRGLG